jgi:glycosyltransferase involved in cell wall biosynthesis
MLESPRLEIKVTIGVCARDCENDVRKIVDRILSQDFPHDNMEVIFVDDGSQDNTLSAIQHHASTLNMKYSIYHHEWKGLGYSRNVVLKNAKGKFIVWVDDGTAISKDYVRRNVKFMEDHPMAGIARGLIRIYDGSSRVAALENMVALTYYNRTIGAVSKLPGTGGAIYRTESARRVGGFNENIQGATEDVDIGFRIASAGWQIHTTPVALLLEYNDELKKVWNKSFWYGYGAHFSLHRHRALSEILYKSTPIAGFLQGILVCSFAYRATRKKIAFLLPIFFSIKRSAFCLGFAKSHFNSYGHVNN